MQKSEQYLNQFKKSHQLKDWVAYFSALTWEAYSFPHKSPALPTYETETTNRLVKELFKAILEYPLPIRIFQAKNEKVNGNDLELVLPTKKGMYIRFFCQAKRIEFDKNNPNGKYNLSRTQRNNKTEQIERLLRYGEKNNDLPIKGFPIYMFYNYSEENIKLDKCANGNKELYGCTLTSAHYLASMYLVNGKMKTANFKELHPPSKPLVILSEMVETDFIKSLGSKFGKITNLKEYPCKPLSYTEKELYNEGFWDEIFPRFDEDDSRRSQTDQELERFKKLLKADNYDTFSPAYRIVFTTYPILERKINQPQI